MEDQIILVDKPTGISSFGVVAKVRGKLKAKFGHKIKVGHTGTLDPFATGLLILLSGKMTKKSNEFLKLDKVYEATLKLGYTSTTGDPEGEIQEKSSYVPNTDEIKNVIKKFKNLRIVATRSTGYEHIDLKCCAGKNIAVFALPNSEFWYGNFCGYTKELFSRSLTPFAPYQTNS